VDFAAGLGAPGTSMLQPLTGASPLLGLSRERPPTNARRLSDPPTACIVGRDGLSSRLLASGSGTSCSLRIAISSGAPELGAIASVSIYSRRSWRSGTSSRSGTPISIGRSLETT
jgi:hypothetical protein